MNADNDFQIGKDHLVCQDYALVGSNADKAFAILCDGCSASPDVDIGARILAMAAKEIYANNLGTLPIDYHRFGLDVIEKAGRIWNDFPHLHRQALDATLLIAHVQNNQVLAYIYGDGVFLHRSQVNGLYAMKVELTSGAPDYLSYNLDLARKKEYEDFSNNDKETKQLEIHDGMKKEILTYKPFDPVVINRPVMPGDFVAISSDGMGSFRRLDDTSIDWFDLAEEFIDYKATAGVFVRRRIAAFKKKCVKEGMTHSDDISVAAIVV